MALDSPGSLWKGPRLARVFEDVPPNEDTELRSYDICPETSLYRWRGMKRFLFPPSLLMVKPLERKTEKTYESLSLSDISQQHVRVCHSLANNHELMTYKRSRTDGRRDWVLLIEGMYCSDFQTHTPFDALSGDRLDIPLLPSRTDVMFEKYLALENLPKKECIVPCYGTTIAPITSSMWFDAEHVKNIFGEMTSSQELPTLDGIIAECLGSSSTLTSPFFPRSGSPRTWHKIIQSGYIMKTLFIEDAKASTISNNHDDCHVAARNLSPTLSNTMGIFDVIDRQSSLPDLEFLQSISNIDHWIPEKREQQTAVLTSSDGNDDVLLFEPLEYVNYEIEQPALQRSQRKAESLSAWKHRVLSLMEDTWESYFVPTKMFFLDDIKKYCAEPLMNRERWHEGPRDMMARCNKLQHVRSFDLISLCEQQFVEVAYSPCSEDAVQSSLNTIFHKSCTRGTRDILDNERMNVWQIAQDEIQKYQSLDYKQFVEPDYDPPQRRSTSPLELKIWARGVSRPRESISKGVVGLNPRGRSDEANVQDLDLTMMDIDDSALFDIPFEANPTESCVDLHAFVDFAMVCDEKDPNPIEALMSGYVPTEKRKPVARSHAQDIPQNLAEKISLKVPEKLICRPWILQLAQECIREQRAAIYMPSPLSCLPSLSIVMHTLLSRIDEDVRVLVFCLGNPNLPLSIKNYFEEVFGDQYHVATRNETRPNDMNGKHDEDREFRKNLATSRILVTNSASDVEIGKSFSVLFVFFDCAAEAGDKTHLSQSVNLFAKSSSWTDKKQMIFIAPYRTHVSCADFHIHAQALMTSLCIAKAIFCDSVYEEINAALILSRPENLLLVPSRTASNALRVIDEMAKPLTDFVCKPDTSGNHLRGGAERNMLKSMTPSFLESRIDDTLKSADEQQQKGLAELHTLRHARSYALHDGANAAISFLKSAISRLDEETPERLRKVLQALEKEANEELRSEKKYHPVVKAMRKLLISEKLKMKEEERVVTRLWMCQTFSPLVVTESEVMMSGIINGLEDAVEHESAERGATAVCLLESLHSERGQADSQTHFFHRYSHVLFFSEDRTGQDALGRLPPSILNIWYAGGLRLVLISVDESRRIEQAITEGIAWYEELRKKVVRVHGNLDDAQGFITTTLLCPPVQRQTQEDERREVVDIDGDKVIPVDTVAEFSPTPIPELKFSESDILAYASDADLRNTLLEHVNRRRRTVGGSNAAVEVKLVGCRGNAAVTRIACAIAMDGQLRKSIRMHFTFC